MSAQTRLSGPGVEPAVFDPARLAAVRGTGLLDSATQDAWQGLTSLAARLLQAPMAFLTLVDDQRSFWLSTEGVDRAQATQNPVEESFCQYVIADRAPLVIDDATEDPRVCGNPSVTGMGVRAWLGFPVLDGAGLPLGSFCVMDTVTRSWTAQDVSTLEVLAQAASAQIALVAALRAEQDARDDLQRVEQAANLHAQQLSEALQRSLLTQPPSPGHLQTAARYLPAVQSAQVGGDWHDAHDNGRGSLLISVGDVAGHESNSAAAMAQIRNLLRGLAVDSDDSPAVLLSRLDHAMDRFGLGTLATALLGRLDVGPSDLQRGVVQLRWSSAGHLPPLLRLPDGDVRTLSSDSDPMLGISPDLPRVERVTELPFGSTLLLCTDGLVERRGESITDGLQRLAEALARHGHLGLEELCDAVLHDVLPPSGDDDTALLVVRPTAPA